MKKTRHRKNFSCNMVIAFAKEILTAIGVT